VGWPGPRNWPWRWPESNRLRQRLQGAPATSAVTPADRLRHHLPGLPFPWCLRYGRVNYPACTRGFSGRSIRPEVMKPPRRDFPLGRLRVTACSRLPGNHSAGQGSRKPRRRIHVSGPLRRLARGHVSMVSRCQKPGNCIFRGIPRCGARPGDGARIPTGAGFSVWRDSRCGGCRREGCERPGRVVDVVGVVAVRMERC
jgi:hypothetical protein